MASSVNKVILLGRVGNDPEVRTSQDGNKIVTFSLATSEVWKDKNSGERKERSEWHRIVVFNQNLAAVCEKYVHKGSRLYIEGQLQTRKWQDSNGIDRFTTEIVLSQFRGDISLLDPRQSDNLENHTPSDNVPHEIVDDDIPF